MKTNVRIFSYDKFFITAISFVKKCENDMDTKNKRGHRASETQKKYLIDFLENRPDLANDKFTTADGAHTRDNEWKELSFILNSLGGTFKDGPKWRKYWKDLTISVRSRDSAIKSQRQKSGVNGPIPIKDLTDLDRRVINIITLEAVEGVSAIVSEIGFEPIIIQREDDLPNIEDEDELYPSVQNEREEIPTTSRSTSTGNRRKRPRRTLSNSTDDALAVYREIEEKKMKLEEKKIMLMEENNKIQININKKLDELLQALLNKK